MARPLESAVARGATRWMIYSPQLQLYPVPTKESSKKEKKTELADFSLLNKTEDFLVVLLLLLLLESFFFVEENSPIFI